MDKKLSIIIAIFLIISPLPSMSFKAGRDDVILITGFEPFDKWKENPSEIVALSLNGSYVNNARIVSIILPVDFNNSFLLIKKAIKKYNPSVIIMLGLNGRSREIHVEKVALNLKCNGWRCSRIKEGEPFLISPVPAIKICSELREYGIKARPSIYAGTYSCNYVFYMTMSYEKNATVSFIHLPPLNSQAKYGMDEKEMGKGVKIIAGICYNYTSSRL